MDLVAAQRSEEPGPRWKCLSVQQGMLEGSRSDVANPEARPGSWAEPVREEVGAGKPAFSGKVETTSFVLVPDGFRKVPDWKVRAG